MIHRLQQVFASTGNEDAVFIWLELPDKPHVCVFDPAVSPFPRDFLPDHPALDTATPCPLPGDGIEAVGADLFGLADPDFKGVSMVGETVYFP